ncbi:MAG: tRNA preQ1(34) S-adenosylmethionine ribosyltransferase-isomerase QueA [Proteobacteria bacterium]|nr:tRNA preQ1(34) S-adenosylmethionine ribosyltransferase-isomerase QueA [Pseudomonadota bacterium]MBI3499844.1 tRNA preQ1(34) S-adenosylmethionine ribosyltransferase-isomerase QueA [Pseudomonadota bacterium]
MRIEDFDFELPPDRIARHPARPRDRARLLDLTPTANQGGLVDRQVSELPELLAPGDVLILNDTRVIPARLVGRVGEARVEVTLHKREGDGIWAAFARPARKLADGKTIEFAPGFAARVAAKREAGEVVFDFAMPESRLADALRRHGALPLPPYIPRPHGVEPTDEVDYQTVYARRDGAVAAPTAGLHFTPALIQRLSDRGITMATVTLHVGAGTFLPVKVADPSRHKMHAEWGEVSPDAAQAINGARAQGGRIVAVGTTSLRLIESATSADGYLQPFQGETRLFITPGYAFKLVDRLITNFHLPRSTLFMLVAAFSGLERIRQAYAHAIQAGYRFYSYGDCCLLPRAA